MKYLTILATLIITSCSNIKYPPERGEHKLIIDGKNVTMEIVHPFKAAKMCMDLTGGYAQACTIKLSSTDYRIISPANVCMVEHEKRHVREGDYHPDGWADCGQVRPKDFDFESDRPRH